MSRSHVRIALFTLLLIAVCAIPLFVHGQDQGGFKALSKDADKLFGQVAPTPGSTANLSGFLNKAFTMALSIGAILAVLRIAWAGYQYMSSDAWGEKSHAKEILGDVVIGLLLLLSVYVILNQINPTMLNLQIKGVTVPQGSTQEEAALINNGGTP